MKVPQPSQDAIHNFMDSRSDQRTDTFCGNDIFVSLRNSSKAFDEESVTEVDSSLARLKESLRMTLIFI